MQNQVGNGTDPRAEDWKTRTYLMGAGLGAVLGLMSAYMFSRAAEENEDARPAPIPTTTLIGILLSLMTLIRQIAETGKKKK